MADAGNIGVVPNCYKADGIVLEEWVLKDNLTKYRDFQVFSDDTFIFNYLRTGSTWVTRILAGLLEGPEKGDTLDLDERFPFLELSFPSTDDYPAYDGLQKCSEQPRPRFIKSHLPPQLAPRDIGNGKIIFVIRDPADSLVSYYHFYKSMAWVNFTHTIDELFEAWMSGNVGYGSYWDWHRDWASLLEKLPANNMHIVNFEQLKARPQDEILRLARFINRDISVLEAEKIEKISEFSRMQQTVNTPLMPQFIRSGQVGEGERTLGKGQMERLAAAMSHLKMQCPMLPLDHY